MNVHVIKKSKEVCLRAAKTSGISPETLLQLAENENIQVRRVVAGRQKTPFNALAYLAGDSYRQVRFAVVQNPSTPPEIMSLLVTDRHWEVREFAKAALVHRNA